MRKKLLMGNWKMNKTLSEALSFAKQTDEIIALAVKHNIDLGIAPTYLCLKDVKENVDKNLIVSSQNVHFEDHGAFTGEISIPMLKDINIDYSIIGHSERRTYDNETDEKCNKKIIALIQNDMTPIYCVGETLIQFENGDTKKVIETQIRKGLANLNSEQVKNLVIAYEPVWSIGTGKNASKEIAQDICKFIRDILSDMFGEVSQDIRILYGGSVKPENIKQYLSCPDVDGALVGGASLNIDSYKQLLINII